MNEFPFPIHLIVNRGHDWFEQFRLFGFSIAIAIAIAIGVINSYRLDRSWQRPDFRGRDKWMDIHLHSWLGDADRPAIDRGLGSLKGDLVLARRTGISLCIFQC